MDLAIDHEMFDDGGVVLETVAERYTDDVMARFAQREYEPVFAGDCLALLERSDIADALRLRLARAAL